MLLTLIQIEVLVEVHVDEISVPLDVRGVLKLRIESSTALDSDWSRRNDLFLIIKLDHIECNL